MGSIVFRDMRRKKQQLSQEECLTILDTATSGVLAVLGDDGYPYGAPLSFVRIGSKLVFHSAAEGHKIDAIKAHPQASFTVVAQDKVVPSEYNTHFRSVIAFGRVRIVQGPEEKMTLLRALGDHYWPNHDDELAAEIAPRFNHMHVLAFDIEHLTGKQSLALMEQPSWPAGLAVASCHRTINTTRRDAMAFDLKKGCRGPNQPEEAFKLA